MSIPTVVDPVHKLSGDKCVQSKEYCIGVEVTITFGCLGDTPLHYARITATDRDDSTIVGEKANTSDISTMTRIWTVKAFRLIRRIGEEIQSAEFIGGDDYFRRVGPVTGGDEGPATFWPNTVHVESDWWIVGGKLQIPSYCHVVQLSANGGIPEEMFVWCRCGLNVSIG